MPICAIFRSQETDSDPGGRGARTGVQVFAIDILVPLLTPGIAHRCPQGIANAPAYRRPREFWIPFAACSRRNQREIRLRVSIEPFGCREWRPWVELGDRAAAPATARANLAPSFRIRRPASVVDSAIARPTKAEGHSATDTKGSWPARTSERR